MLGAHEGNSSGGDHSPRRKGCPDGLVRRRSAPSFLECPPVRSAPPKSLTSATASPIDLRFEAYLIYVRL
jgi:hypothetical protein